jgi:uncharacterized protein (DUF2267 family)
MASPANPIGCVTRRNSSRPVAAELDDIGPINPENATRAVFAVLEHRVAPDEICAPGEIKDIKATLPTQLRELWS